MNNQLTTEREKNISRTIEATTGASSEKDADNAKPQMMKTIRIHKYGGPEVMHYEEAPRPRAKSDEVLIRVIAAGVNPADWKIREGYTKDFFIHKFPLILGWDSSGVVEEVGSGVSRFKKGDEVYSVSDFSRDGTYAKYVAVRESAIAFKPKSLHHVHAAAVPVAALTAWQALFDAAQLKTGQCVLVHAASGGVGHFAVQLAKWKGTHVIGTASKDNHGMLYQLGVDQAIDYTTQRFEDVARDVDVVIDPIAGETQERSWKVLKRGGILVSLHQHASDKATKALGLTGGIVPLHQEKAKALGLRGAYVAVKPNGAQLAKIAAVIDSGNLKPVVSRVLPLSEARRALNLSQSSHIRGKMVLRVNGPTL